MKQIIVFLLIVILISSIGFLTYADYYPSPTVTEHDIRTRYYPSITTNVYRVCNSKGELVKFFDLRDVSYDLMDDLTDIHSGDRFVFNISLKTELVRDEYMELIVVDEDEIIVYNNDVKVPVEKFGEYNIIHVIESGIIRIT